MNFDTFPPDVYVPAIRSGAWSTGAISKLTESWLPECGSSVGLLDFEEFREQARQLRTADKISSSPIGFMDSLLLLFLHLSPFRLGFLNDLLLQLRRNDVVVMHLHVEAAAALGHGGEVNAVSQHLRHWGLGLYDRVPTLVVHALNATAPRVEVAHDRASEFVRHRDLNRHDRLEQRWLGQLHGFLEGNAAGHLE